jgi:hypothetical protein
MSRRLTRWLLSGLLAGAALSTLTGGFGVQRDEFECEQAVAHLEECCPGFDGRSLICSSGCGYEAGPDLHPEGSECIIGATCESLQTSGACGAPKRVTCE